MIFKAKTNCTHWGVAILLKVHTNQGCESIGLGPSTQTNAHHILLGLFTAHLIQNVFEKCNTTIIIIPATCASAPLPLDISVIRHFKTTLRILWLAYMVVSGCMLVMWACLAGVVIMTRARAVASSERFLTQLAFTFITFSILWALLRPYKCRTANISEVTILAFMASALSLSVIIPSSTRDTIVVIVVWCLLFMLLQCVFYSYIACAQIGEAVLLWDTGWSCGWATSM